MQAKTGEGWPAAPEMTVHVLVGGETEPAPPVVGPGVHLDLRLLAPSRPSSQVGWVRPRLHVVVAESDEVRRTFLMEHARFVAEARKLLCRAESLLNLPLASLLPVAVKHPRHPIFSLFVASETVLQGGAQGDPELQVLFSANSVRVWCQDPLAADLFSHFLRRTTASGDCRPAAPGGRQRLPLLGAKLVLGLLRLYRAQARLLLAGPWTNAVVGDDRKALRPAPKQTKVLVLPLLVPSISGESHAQDWTMYFGDMADKLNSLGVPSAWLPVPPPPRRMPFFWQGAARHYVASPALIAASFAPGLLRAPVWTLLNILLLLQTSSPRKQSARMGSLHIGGLRLGDMTRAELQSTAAAGRLLYYACVRDYLRSAFERIQPSCVIMRDEFYSIGRLITFAARMHGVRTFSLQHGTIRRNHLVYQLSRLHWESMPSPDLFLVYSESDAQRFCSWGYPRSGVQVLGSPRHDDATRWLDMPATERRLLARESLGLPSAPFLVLLCGQRPADLPEWFSLTAAAWPGGFTHGLAFRPHWNFADAFDPSPFLGFIAPELYFLASAHDSMSWIAAADLVLTGTSTVGVEAVLLGVPVGCFVGDTVGNSLVESGQAVPIRTAEGLRDLLRGCSIEGDGRNDRHSRAPIVFREVGTATERLAVLLRGWIGSHHDPGLFEEVSICEPVR